VKVKRISPMVKDLLDSLGITEPPVNLELVAGRQGVNRIVDAPLGGLWGTLSDAPGQGVVISLNQAAPQKRRFTLAHEIAHTMLGHGRPKPGRLLMRKPATHSALERKCDLVAGELLMPQHMLVPRLERAPVSLATIVSLAEAFDTSIEAAAVRFAQLSPHQVRVACWQVANGEATIKWTRGRILRGTDVVRGQAWPLADWPTLQHADLCDHTAVGSEQIERESVYCEARAFGLGNARYILSLLKPAVSPSGLKGRQLREHRGCRMRSPSGRKESNGIRPRR